MYVEVVLSFTVLYVLLFSKLLQAILLGSFLLVIGIMSSGMVDAISEAQFPLEITTHLSL
jgi:hypothetical protein